jgi:glucose-6-phosphate 1-dehydrogenase
VLSLSVSGAGAIDLRVVTKEPGPDLALAEATTTLDLADVPGGSPLPPYVSLIHDVVVGDRSLFTTSDGLAHAWRAVAPLLADRPQVQPYAPGSWGPAAANDLAAPAGWLLGQTED